MQGPFTDGNGHPHSAIFFFQRSGKQIGSIDFFPAENDFTAELF